MAALEIDGALLAAADEYAAEEGVPTATLVERAVRRYMVAGRARTTNLAALGEVVRELQERGPNLDEDEGAALAYTELRAMRAERDSDR